MKKKDGFEGQRSCILPESLLEEVTRHPLCQGLYITDIGYYPRALFHNRERKKGIKQHILIYCLQGSGRFGVEEKEYEVKANQVFMLPAGKRHQYQADNANPWSIYWLHFSGLLADSFRQYLHADNDYAPLTVIPDESRIRLFEDIFSHLNMSFNMDNIIFANNCLYHFLVSFRESVFRSANPPEQPDAVSRSIDFMKAHLSQNFTLQELALEAGLSVSHYSASFRRQTQNSPVNFFTFLKMQRACQLLENTHLRIKEIADQLGFTDPYHFSRVFSNTIGLSPKEFRNKEKA